jgi:hypothetical protein
MNFKAFLKSEVVLESGKWRHVRSLLLCVTCIIGCSSIFAQDSNSTYKNTVSIEALGLGRYGSAEYEVLLRKGKLVDYYAAAGFAMVRFFNYENKFKPDVFIPMMGRAVFGQKSHHLELSFGQVVASYSTFSVAKGGEDRELEVSLALGTAYRFHTPQGRWQYRATFYKILDDFDNNRIWIGVAAGYRFNVKN